MVKFYHIFFIGFLSQTVFSQTITPSTIREIYNFDVGDTFEYEINTQSINDQYGCNLQGWEMRIILSKEEYPDLITYTFLRNSTDSYNCHQYGNSGSSRDTSQLTVTQLDSTIFWYHTYHAFGYDSNGNYYLDTVYIDSSMNNLKINAHSEGGWGGGEDTAYADGVGLIQAFLGSEDFEIQQGGESLIYYHKANGQSWGTLVDFAVTGVRNIDDELSMHIFPNPASSSFQVQLSESPSPPTYLQLYDALGRQVREERITETSSTIQRNTLSNGIYFWQLESNGQTLSRGKIVFE